MASKKKSSVIGFDPLAWMKEPSPGPEIGSRKSTAKSDPDPIVSAPDPEPQTPDLGARTVDSPGAVALGDTLTIEQVAAMHAELGRHLGATSIALDAGALQRIDAAGLQLLAAFMRTADGHGTKVEWRAPSPVLRDGARRLGLAGTLRLD